VPVALDGGEGLCTHAELLTWWPVPTTNARQHHPCAAGSSLLARGRSSDTEPVVRGEVRRSAGLVRQNTGTSEVVIALGGHSRAFMLDQLGALAAFVAKVGTFR
jgi:hypothetical protein